MNNRTIETIFGAAEITEAQCWRAHMSLPGFPDRHHFVLIDLPTYRPLTWLQSTDDHTVCFPLTLPECASLHYPLPPTEALFGHRAPHAMLLVMTVFERQSDGSMQVTPHARAPLCFDPDTMQFVQWILASDNAWRHISATPPDTVEMPLPTVAVAGAA